MKTTALTRLAAFILVGLGLLIAAMGVHVADVDDPLWSTPEEVSSVIASAPSPQYAAAVERAQEIVRAAVVEQNLPGVSVAVGAGGTIVWAEGFGWRDVATRTPITPDTRFNIGTAASVVADAVAPLGLSDTGTDSPEAWSPEHIGEPEEDFPLFTLVRDVILRPIGLAAAQPLPGDRATFYVPRSADAPGRGRRLMPMRELACCSSNGMASYSTPSDLARFALATTPGSVNGELAGGTVMSLTTRDEGVSVAVTSNLAHANTASLALRVGDAFASARRPETFKP